MTARSARSKTLDVCVEATAKRTFASALAWPGWCRAGRDEEAALAALSAYRPRYAPVAAAAGVPFRPAGDLVVVERSPGTATTEFGAPAVVAQAERRPLTAAEARRVATLVDGCWTVFDEVVARAPRSLRKGPRGGGRDRDAVVDHVLAAEASYARKLDISVKQSRGDGASITDSRAALLEALRSARGDPPDGRGWPPLYAARRIAWHVLDHAWEIEDRTDR